MDLNEALKYIKSGEAVIFTGAGFSYGAKNVSGKSVPSVSDLHAEILGKLGLDEDELNSVATVSLKDLSNYFQKQIGTRRFIKFLKDSFSVKSGTESQRVVANQPWQGMFTSNYDDLFEVLTAKESISATTSSEIPYNDLNVVVHVNGAIKTLSPNNVKDGILLTNDSYIRNSFRDTPFEVLFRDLVRSTKAVFFVGFSFNSDEELAKIYTDLNAKQKTFFVTSTPNIFEKNRLELLGNITGWTTEKFADELNKLPDIEVKRSTIDNMRSFTHIDGNTRFLSDEISDSKLEKLVRTGVLDDEYVLDDHYIVPRWENSADIVSKRSAKLFIVQGKLGNGKTIFMKGLAKYLAKTNNVFYFNGKPEYFSEDLRTIRRESDDAFVFIDDFYKVQQLFSSLKVKTDDMTFVISGRTSLIPQSLAVLSKQANFKDDEILTLKNLDILSKDEFSIWKKNMDRYNLWGGVNAKDVIKENKPEFSKILVKYFKSTGIYSQFKESLITNKTNATMHIAIASLVTNLLSSKVPLFTILNILNESLTSDMKPQLSNFISFEDTDIIINTNVLAKMLLNDPNLFESTDIMNTIEVMMQGYDRVNNSSSAVYSAKKDLVSFSNIQLILGTIREKKEWELDVDLYYKNVQNLTFTKSNPFFWLQFANSKIDAKEWSMAKLYIENAYKHLNSGNTTLGDDFQISTTELNLYMESANHFLDTDMHQFIENMRKSAEILVKNNNFDYVVTILAKLGDRPTVERLKKLNAANKREISNIFFDFYTYIKLMGSEAYKDDPRRYSKYINSIKFAMEAVVN